MHQTMKLSLKQIQGDLTTYFNWSANVLMPINPNAADHYLRANRMAIVKVAQKLLQVIQYAPVTLYRGILLKQQVSAIEPHDRLQYLSFSEDLSVAQCFADPRGFGNELVNLESRLGRHGYVIEYTPTLEEILFHYHFLAILPYAEAFTLLGMNGGAEVSSLHDQKEVTILQPASPFVNITSAYHRAI